MTKISNERLAEETKQLVDRFAVALKEKLLTAQQKYGYATAWMNDDWMDECRENLIDHVEKGDPRDVAAYCAFLWHHRERTANVPLKEARQRINRLRECLEEEIFKGQQLRQRTTRLEEALRLYMATAADEMKYSPEFRHCDEFARAALAGEQVREENHAK